jgi:hypothetical protein
MKRRTLFESMFLLGAAGIGRYAAQAAGIVEKNAGKIRPVRPFIETPDGTGDRTCPATVMISIRLPETWTRSSGNSIFAMLR